MPFLFTPSEYVDMLIIYGECRKDCRRARNLYRVRYPDRPAPSKDTFKNIEQKLRTGSFPNGKAKQEAPRKKLVQTDDNRINILAYLQINPHASIRCLVEELGISKSTIQRVLKNQRYHPYKIHLVQGLTPRDPDQRLTFIARMNDYIDEDVHFLNRILWGDESRFHNNGTVNRHNCHYWSSENPKWTRENRFQTVWGVNVWCGVFNGRLIGPHFYDGTLTGERYLDFLQNVLPILLEDVPLNERQTMWWQQDGATPHFHQGVREYLNRIFPERWIGRGGPIYWPARSPDLTPVDYFLWGHLKGIVYSTQPEDLEDLKNKIREACRTVTPEIIRAACNRNLLNRFENCVTEGGNQFEHLL